MGWQRRMYDREFAEQSLASSEMLARAADEVDFVVERTGVRSGDTVLDVCCGAGRHCQAFADRGFDVVGVDINPQCLALARELCPSGEFMTVDMADLSEFRGRASLVINMFSSFGYFADDEANFAALREMAAAVRRPGHLVIQAIEYHWLTQNYRAVKTEQHGSTFVLEARTLDSVSRYNESNRITLDESTGQGRRYYVRDRVYAVDEMQDLLRKAGAHQVEVFADPTGAPFRRGESSHPIYIASFR